MEEGEARKKALNLLDRAGIVITPEEEKNLEITDLELGRLRDIGIQILTYVNTNRYCAKEIVMLPGQTCPEHRHPEVAGEPGKQETFRCRWGKVYLFLEGESTEKPECEPPAGNGDYYTAEKQVILEPGDQFTIPPNTWHWFQPGSEGAVISEFSSTSRDENDVFRNPNIKRE